jgi:NAD(P)-dependent dehydrogenase (short-subunit alcohol dehydrogenase family)
MADEWGALRLSGRLLEGRSVVITGAGSPNGIGRATAKLFAAHGARVASFDIDEQGAQETAAGIGEQHIGLRCDITEQASCASAIDQVMSIFGRVDVLINNAAVARGTRIADVSLEEYDAVQAINLRGTFLMSQLVLPSMRAMRSGNIVCLASVAGQRGGGLYGSAHYAASKAGVIGLGKGMARELAPDGIRVNVVSPSLIKTDGSPDDTPERRANFEKDVPMGRSGTVWEVAGAILFAASDLSGYITGATIDVNGGFYMR